MKLLKDLLYGCRLVEVDGATHTAVDHVAFDSRKVRAMCLFVAVRGTQADGHAFIEQAVHQGAVAVVCEALPAERKKGVTYVKVENSAHALGIIASNFYDNPSQRLKVVGVTGTNGKTTTVSLLFDLFRKLGHKCGKLTTIENRINNEVLPSTHTTPDALQLQALLKRMVEAGCKFCFMEASSHAIHQHRVAGVDFAGAVFTNITHDHLDYHKTFDAYIAAKKALFDGLSAEAFALYNADDRQGPTMVQNCRGSRHSYALRTMADFHGRVVENQLSGLLINLGGTDLYSRLVGSFNTYNLLAVYGTAMLLKQARLDVLTHLSTLSPASGRFEHFKTPGNVTAVIDYAHTPDALENVLKTLNDLRAKDRQIVTVVGCGGNRDAAKRPEMARIAASMSQRVVFTSDNPRFEEPGDILREMRTGVPPEFEARVVSVEDRREAIRLALGLCNAGDLLLVAGKGHEKYQEIKGEKLPFDDVEVVKESVKILGK